MKDKIQQSVGKKATVILGGLIINVKVKNYKRSYGNERWLVTPISGAGEVWVQKVDISGKRGDM